MARRTAALPHHSAPVQRRCWPHRGPRSGAPASRAIPLLIASNPVFSAIADIESRNYNWLLLSFGASQFFSNQCHAPLAAALARCQRCGHRQLAQRQRAARRQCAHPSVAFFFQQEALSRVQQRCSKPSQTLSTPSPSILHTCPSFHTRHFHYRHPYTRMQYRLGHRSRTNLTHHMT